MYEIKWINKLQILKNYFVRQNTALRKNLTDFIEISLKFFSDLTVWPTEVMACMGMSHRWLLPIIVCSNDDHRLTFTYFTAWVDHDLCYGKVKFGNLGFSIEKSENCWFFRTFAACDLKPIEIMKICEIEGQGHFLTLAQGHLHLKIKTGFSQKWFWTKFYFVLCLNIRWGFHRTIGPLVLFMPWNCTAVQHVMWLGNSYKCSHETVHRNRIKLVAGRNI